MRIRADLHVHTRASDGDLMPAEVVSRACSAGLHAISITDHDTLAGLREAIDASRGTQVQVVPGVEISARFEPGSLHMLGYFPSFPEGFEQVLKPFQQAREARCPRILEKLKDLGIEITPAEVTAVAGGAQIGRPHIARVLIEKGVVGNFDEAFSRYLAKGRPAYVEKEKMDPGEAIGAILEHGGLPVLAHPFTLGLGGGELRDFLRELAGDGLAGIEIPYPDHTPVHRRLFSRTAKELDLLVTGGTDYHGPGRDGPDIGACGLETRELERFLERLHRG
ncbi:MAG: PHP domain-containing protein [Desulfomonilia bacterium]